MLHWCHIHFGRGVDEANQLRHVGGPTMDVHVSHYFVGVYVLFKEFSGALPNARMFSEQTELHNSLLTPSVDEGKQCSHVCLRDVKKRGKRSQIALFLFSYTSNIQSSVVSCTR